MDLPLWRLSLLALKPLPPSPLPSTALSLRSQLSQARDLRNALEEHLQEAESRITDLSQEVSGKGRERRLVLFILPGCSQAAVCSSHSSNLTFLPRSDDPIFGRMISSGPLGRETAVGGAPAVGAALSRVPGGEGGGRQTAGDAERDALVPGQAARRRRGGREGMRGGRGGAVCSQGVTMCTTSLRSPP